MRNSYHLFAGILLYLCSFHSYAQPYNFDGVADGSTGNLSNGWTGSHTSGYRWEANSGMTVSSGTGPSADHTTGTGIYMYTEASTPAAVGDITNLESPTINLTTYTYPGLSFWYHKAGAGMGNMYIDIYHNGSWTNDVDSIIGSTQNTETDPWLNKLVDLTAYAGSNIKVRFRAIFGTTWSGDMAIDDVDFIELPPYDPELVSLFPDKGYYSMPLSQIQTITFGAEVKNNGVDTITDVKLYQYDGTNIDSGSIAQLTSQQADTIYVSNGYSPSTVGVYDLDFYVGLNENDTNQVNDSAFYQVAVSDSVYARENDNITLGIGFTNGTGIFGQMFEFINQDTITQVDLKLVAPTQNDQLKVKIYHFTNGMPGAIIDSSAVFTIPSNLDAWYSLKFKCDLILPAGQYFVAVEQLSLNNLSFGYTPEFYESGVSFFNAGAGWTAFETSGFEVSLGLRVIVGTPFFPEVKLGNDTAICSGQSLTLNAGSGYAVYNWSNSGTNQYLSVNSSGTYTVVVETASGCSATDSISVLVNPTPTSVLASDTTCYGANTTLTANTSSQFSYNWSTGDTTSSITASATTTYYVTITDTTGCTLIDSAQIVAGDIPTVNILNDSINFCEGDTGTLFASGQNDVTFMWSNGQPGITTDVTMAGYYTLTGTSTISGCTAVDSAFVNIYAPPTVDLGADTTICDGDNVIITLTGYTSYSWSNGFISNSVTITDSGTYHVTVTDMHACEGTDSITVSVEICSNVENIVAQNAFRVYPNPAKNIINIEVDYAKKTTFKMLNIEGREVLKGKLNTGAVQQIDVTTLPPGVYFLEIRSDTITELKRVVIN